MYTGRENSSIIFLASPSPSINRLLSSVQSNIFFLRGRLGFLVARVTLGTEAFFVIEGFLQTRGFTTGLKEHQKRDNFDVSSLVFKIVLIVVTAPYAKKKFRR